MVVGVAGKRGLLHGVHAVDGGVERVDVIGGVGQAAARVVEHIAGCRDVVVAVAVDEQHLAALAKALQQVARELQAGELAGAVKTVEAATQIGHADGVEGKLNVGARRVVIHAVARRAGAVDHDAVVEHACRSVGLGHVLLAQVDAVTIGAVGVHDGVALDDELAVVLRHVDGGVAALGGRGLGDGVALDEGVACHVHIDADASGLADGIAADDGALSLAVTDTGVGEVDADATALQGVVLDDDVVTGLAVAGGLDSHEADARGGGGLVGLHHRAAQGEVVAAVNGSHTVAETL